MQRSAVSLTLGLAIVAGAAGAAHAFGGRHNGSVATPYGTFSAKEMAAGGGNPEMAMQLRQQKQFLQYQQQAFKQEQAYQQQQAKQAEFLKKHPEAVKAMSTPARATATKKVARKADKKKADGIATPAATPAATPTATAPKTTN